MRSSSWPRAAVAVTTFLLVASCFIAVLPCAGAHIIGPGIVAPVSSGFTFVESGDDVVESSIAEIDRVGRPQPQMGLGFVFGGTIRLANGTRQGWIGMLALNGTVAWELRRADPRLQRVTSVQFNTSNEVYFAGHGDAGPAVLKTSSTGDVAWIAGVGSAGDRIARMAIIKHDAGYTLNDNGITVAGTRANGTSFVANLDSAGSWRFERNEPAGKVVTCIATDPLLPSIVYVGGSMNGNPFVEQLHLATGTANWTRVVDSGEGVINAIQVEPVYGGVIAVGRLGHDVLIHPFTWYGTNGWNLLDPPHVRFGGTAMDEATGVVIVGEQDFKMYVCGTTTSYATGETDVLVLKVSFNARIEWERTWGAMHAEAATSISAEPGYAVYVSGTTNGRGFIVENPAGTINPFARWLGSTQAVLAFLVVAFVAVPAGLAGVVLLARRRKAGAKLDAWIDGQRRPGGRAP